MLSLCGTEECGHEAHGCTCRLDVDNVGHVFEGIDDNLSVIAIAEIGWLNLATCYSVYDECSVADALARWQVDGCVQLLGSFYDVSHCLYLLFLLNSCTLFSQDDREFSFFCWQFR